MTIVDRIKQKCKESGRSLSNLEAECGLGHATIRRWNDNSPAVEKAQEVANLLKVSLDWLITGKEAEELTPEEQQLVDYYRRTNPTGKSLTIQTAKANSEALPADPELKEEHPAGVSASAIG